MRSCLDHIDGLAKLFRAKIIVDRLENRQNLNDLMNNVHAQVIEPENTIKDIIDEIYYHTKYVDFKKISRLTIGTFDQHFVVSLGNNPAIEP